jgi:cobaltochelatase CobN
VALVTFYRALLQSGDLAPVDALLASLAEHGHDALALAVTSLKEPAAAALVEQVVAESRPDVILNLTGFAVGTPGADTSAAGPFAAADCPVLQAILSGATEDDWRASTRGLGPRDLAMNVALPEVDGRIITRAVSFKSEASPDPLTEHARVAHRPVPDRIDLTARLAAAWTRLRRAPPSDRRVALILANYPTRDGRIGNGVGLDTPPAPWPS